MRPSKALHNGYGFCICVVDGLHNLLLQILMKHAMEDIILHYTYPRIDAEVSKHRNHLLKAPFCVHPKTGRVCVPIDPAKVEAFDPEKVPTIGQLLTELDELIPVDGQETSGESLPRYTGHRPLTRFGLDADLVARTSLHKYIQILDDHAARLMVDKQRAKQEPGALSMIQVTGRSSSSLQVLPCPGSTHLASLSSTTCIATRHFIEHITEISRLIQKSRQSGVPYSQCTVSRS